LKKGHRKATKNKKLNVALAADFLSDKLSSGSSHIPPFSFIRYNIFQIINLGSPKVGIWNVHKNLYTLLQFIKTGF